MKTGKEIKNNTFKKYNVTFGSVDNKNAKSVYINLSSWVEPKEKDEDINYNRCIKNINKKIRQTVYNLLNTENTPFLKNLTIIDLDIRESGIRYGKRSFMSCEITLYTSDEIPINDEYMKDTLAKIYLSVIKNVFDTNEIFNFNKKKK
jgi:hypothetical protein